jgi:flagellar hook-length control protein FliK
MNGKEFAGLMRDLINKSERQEVATSKDESSDATPNTDSAAAISGLQTMPLGDQFSVITTIAPLPDASSLAAFARAQGLGEGAVKALFGDIANTRNSDTQTTSLSTSLNASTSSAVLDLGNALTATNLGGFGTVTNLPISGNPNTATTQETNLLPSTATLNWLSSHPNALTIGTGMTTSAGSTALGMNDESANPLSLNTTKASDLSNLLGAAGATGVLQTISAASPLNVSAPTQAEIAAELPPDMGPIDAMRMRLVPEWETMTKQLAKLNGDLQTTTWGEIMSSKLAKKESGLSFESTLDLGSSDIGLDIGADLAVALGSGANDNASATPLNATDNTKAPVSLSALANSSISAQGDKAQMTDRAGHIQDLANKLGQALGERLQEQMERGQWRMNLKLNPGHLGQIDVELDMHAGGLDAVFRTENMLTKELITQGMSKLKDSLAQSGTAVADVWVNSESKRESGGNPTPQRFSGDNGPDGAADGAKPVQQASRMIEKRSADAWDTLA